MTILAAQFWYVYNPNREIHSYNPDDTAEFLVIDFPEGETDGRGLASDNLDILLLGASTRRIYRLDGATEAWDEGIDIPVAATFPNAISYDQVQNRILMLDDDTDSLYTYQNEEWDEGFELHTELNYLGLGYDPRTDNIYLTVRQDDRVYLLDRENPGSSLNVTTTIDENPISRYLLQGLTVHPQNGYLSVIYDISPAYLATWDGTSWSEVKVAPESPFFSDDFLGLTKLGRFNAFGSTADPIPYEHTLGTPTGLEGTFHPADGSPIEYSSNLSRATGLFTPQPMLDGDGVATGYSYRLSIATPIVSNPSGSATARAIRYQYMLSPAQAISIDQGRAAALPIRYRYALRRPSGRATGGDRPVIPTPPDSPWFTILKS